MKIVLILDSDFDFESESDLHSHSVFDFDFGLDSFITKSNNFSGSSKIVSFLCLKSFSFNYSFSKLSFIL